MSLPRYRARDPSSEAAVRFVLIPDALPAVQAHLDRPDDDPPSPDELTELVALTVPPLPTPTPKALSFNALIHDRRVNKFNKTPSCLVAL